MKAVKKISIFAVTVLVIVFSLFLPYISSLTVDYHLGTQIRKMGNNDISLQLSDNMEILESVNLFSVVEEISVINKSVCSFSVFI